MTREAQRAEDRLREGSTCMSTPGSALRFGRCEDDGCQEPLTQCS